jgi:septin 6/8/11
LNSGIAGGLQGETALGKSTLVESLFDCPLGLESHTHLDSGVGVSTFSTTVSESSTELELTLITSVGYGDQLDRSCTAKPLVSYIDSQFEAHLQVQCPNPGLACFSQSRGSIQPPPLPALQEELKTKRDLVRLKDSRVHACLVLLNPTGTCLKSLDLVVLRELQYKAGGWPGGACAAHRLPAGVARHWSACFAQVNLIPVIAKADSVTPKEIRAFKELVR